MSQKTLHIGILNLMHNKLATIHDFQQILTTYPDIPVELQFFYPKMHYLDQPVPPEVQANLKPLDLNAVVNLDAFIITGSPIEQIDFEQVVYMPEIKALLAVLEKVPTRLYLCWGAMAALYERYQVQKHNLPQKIFGAYPHDILQHNNPLLAGLPEHFIAPHARYAESNIEDIEAHPDLVEVAKSQTEHLFLIQNKAQTESFLFSHLEYGGSGLEDEYIRETTAHPTEHFLRPTLPQATTSTLVADFPWQQTQRIFFKNWLIQVQTNAR